MFIGRLFFVQCKGIEIEGCFVVLVSGEQSMKLLIGVFGEVDVVCEWFQVLILIGGVFSIVVISRLYF